MALVKILKIVPGFPQWQIGNIYTLDDFEVKKIFTDDSLKGYRSCFARMPETFKDYSRAKVTLGIPKPVVKPSGPDMMAKVAAEKAAQEAKEVPTEEEYFETESKLEELEAEIEEIKEEQEKVSALISDELQEAVLEKAEGERRKELHDLHYTKVKEIGDKYEIEYTSKSDVIDQIILVEYYDY